MTTQAGKALKSFVAMQQRTIAMANLHVELAGRDGGAHHCADDVLRGAAVLAVASMDAFFTRRFAELLVPFLKKHGPNERLIELLNAAGLDTRVALELAAMDRPFRRIRALVRRHLSNYTTQRFAAIDELFLALGAKDLSRHAQGLSKKKTLLRSVELLVERRHAIVHEADVGPNGRLTAIKGPEIVRRLKHLTEYVTHSSALIDKMVKV